MTNTPTNLIESWLAAETLVPGRTAADALRDLNDDLGSAYTHSTLSRWRRGEQSPRPEVIAYMVEMSIGHVLTCVGVRWAPDDPRYDQISTALSPPTG